MVAKLVENVQSILNCTLCSFEDKDIFDHDFNIESTDDNSPFQNNEGDDDCRDNIEMKT